MTSRGIPSPAGKAGISSSATELSQILEKCRQGSSIGRFRFAPVKSSLCSLCGEPSPAPVFLVLGIFFGSILGNSIFLMWVQIFQPFVKAQGFKDFVGFNSLVFT